MRLQRFFLGQPSLSLANSMLLVTRVGFSASLFAIHGWEKLSGFQSMIDRYHMDPLHIGVYPSLAFSTLSDGICTLLIMAGLATRAATAIVVVNLTVVWFVMQDALGVFARFDPNNPMLKAPRGEHTELVFLYLVFFVSLLISGPGQFSLDYWLFGKNSSEP